MVVLIILVSGQTLNAQLDIWVEDHSGYDRLSWPVTGGIPFPKGQIYEAADITVINTPSQVRVLSRWSDGSVKYALIDYQADVYNSSRTTHTISFAGNKGFISKGNKTTETEDKITVNTGVLKFSVSKKEFGFLDEVWLDLNNDGYFNKTERIVRKQSGQEHSYDLQSNNPERPTIPYSVRNLLTGESKPIENSMPVNVGGSRWIRPEGGGKEIRKYARKDFYSAKVVEHGPLRTVLQIKGRFGSEEDDSEYTIWIHAYYGKPFLRIQHNFVFRGDPQKTNIRRMGLKLPLNFDQMPLFKAAGLTQPQQLNIKDTYLYTKGPEDVFNLEHEGFPLSWEVGVGDKKVTGIKKTAGWIDISTPKFGVTVAMKDMAYMYPKELSYDVRNKSVNAWMWPDHGGQVLDLRASGWSDGMQGISFTHDIFYSFHGPQSELGGDVLAALINDPLQPYANPEWYSYRGTKAAGMIMPHDDIQFPKTESYLATGTTFIERSMTEYCWLGMLNYGDLMFMYGYYKGSDGLGTWGISNRQDDYDGWRRGNTMITYRMLMQYLRTGEYRYWKAASAGSVFVRDALIKHYSSRDSRFVGYGRRHSAYWGALEMDEIDRPGGVSYDGYGTNWLGHYIHWNLTGDWRTYEVINEIRSAWNNWGNSDIDQLSGGAYVGLKLISNIPGYELAEKEADKFLTTAIKRTANPGDAWRDCTWFMGYGLYLQDVNDISISKAIVDWWKANHHDTDQWGLNWHRESLAAAYWAAHDNKAIRDSIYHELSTTGSTEFQNSSRIEAQRKIYDQYGVSGLFHSDFNELATAVAPGYWRAKDDIMQMQWDEPLSMAVISHFRENYSTGDNSVLKPTYNLTIKSINNEGVDISVSVSKPSVLSLRVLDKSGSPVWQHEKNESVNGLTIIKWNLKENKVMAGSYTVQLLINGMVTQTSEIEIK